MQFQPGEISLSAISGGTLNSGNIGAGCTIDTLASIAGGTLGAGTIGAGAAIETLASIVGGTLAAGTIGAGVTVSKVLWDALLASQVEFLASGKTITGAFTVLSSGSLGVLTDGQMVLVEIRVIMTKGGTPGESRVRFRQSGGTGSMRLIGAASTGEISQFAHLAAKVLGCNLSQIWKCQGAGTPTMELAAQSIGSNSTSAANTCGFRAYILND